MCRTSGSEEEQETTLPSSARIAIFGASGYGGGELLRWLARHPCARVELAASNTYAGLPVSAAFPGLAGASELRFSPELEPAEMKGFDLVFLARDNGVAMNLAPEILKAGCRAIDLSADFRFRDPATYNAWYPMPHSSPALLAESVYGLPELHREAIRSARLVGNPGCYTTTTILALAPAVMRGLVEPGTIVIDGKSGVSGAGRSKFGMETHFSEVNESVSPYKTGGTHRHTPEIEQELSRLAGAEVRVSFTPHLIPMTRGILASCYASLARKVSAEEIREFYREFYRDAPFIRVTDNLPATKHALGTNFCHIGLSVDERTGRLSVFAATDNLGKGMASQAVQNMNLMLGFEETAGLETGGLWP